MRLTLLLLALLTTGSMLDAQDYEIKYISGFLTGSDQRPDSPTDLELSIIKSMTARVEAIAPHEQSDADRLTGYLWSMLNAKMPYPIAEFTLTTAGPMSAFEQDTMYVNNPALTFGNNFLLGSRYIIYNDRSRNRFTHAAIGETKVFTATLDYPDWHIDTSATRTIAGYSCHKATCKLYTGNMLTAWYTPELPAHLGPSKHVGLPGTILETRSGNSLITAAAVRRLPDTAEPIVMPESTHTYEN